MAQQVYRITHLSDLHLGHIPNMRGLQHRARNWSYFADALGQTVEASFDLTSLTGTYDAMAAGALLRELARQEMSPSGPGVDAILVSGDICSIGALRDLRAARKYLFLGRNEMGVRFPVDKLILMPGNHDRYRPVFPLVSGSTAFEHVDAFDELWSPRNEAVIHPTPVRQRRLPSRGRRGGLSIVCADFSLTAAKAMGRLPFLTRHLNDGSVGDDVLRSLATSTTTAQEEGFAVVWAIHFPPAFPGHLLQQLAGYRALLNEARSCEVRHIFAGHTHDQLVYEVAKCRGVWVHCAGTPTSDGSKRFEFMRHRIGVVGCKVQFVDSYKYRRDPVYGSQPASAAYGSFRLVGKVQVGIDT